jgi:hypothetical protein
VKVPQVVTKVVEVVGIINSSDSKTTSATMVSLVTNYGVMDLQVTECEESYGTSFLSYRDLEVLKLSLGSIA